jgi:hypothetical protein
MSEEQQIPSYFERMKLIKLGLAPKEAVAKAKKPMKRVSDKKKAQDAEAKEARGGEATELQKWYQKIMDSEVPKCWETGEKIDKNDKFGWHGSIAHILPKELFPSVETHPVNYMILKMWGGTHGQYDSNWENAAKMKVWPYALKTIIGTLFPCLTPEEKRKLPEVILQEIDPLKKKIP